MKWFVPTVLAVFLLAGGGCKEVEVSLMDCPTPGMDDVPDVAAPDVAPGDVVADGDGGPVGPEPSVGQACAENADCELNFCLDNAFLQGMGVENEAIDIPNGLCSRMPCNADDQCGPQGVCFNTQPFTGTPISICLQGCLEMADCRWEEGYTCHIAPLDPEDPEAGTIQACLPDSLVVAIECDDGHCEGQEPTFGTCDLLSDCDWENDYTCYHFDVEQDGLCVPDITQVAAECEDGSCPMPQAPAGEGE